MKALKFMVAGKYASEQSSYSGDSPLSTHRDLYAAQCAADRAHYAMGGCDGGNMLARVYERLEPGEVPADEWAATIDFAGHTYGQVDYFAGRCIVACNKGIAAIPRR